MSDTLFRLCSAIDGLNRMIGRVAAWIYPILIGAVVANVVMRYGLNRTYPWLEELQWYLYAAAFLMTFAAALSHDAHIRVDPFRERMSERTKARIEVLGTVFFLMPFCALLAWHAWFYFEASFAISEGSAQSSGLPARWLLKLLLFVSFVLLALQGLAVLAKAARVLMGARE